MTEDPVILAALMPHAPVLVPLVGGKRLNRVQASVDAMHNVARRAVASRPELLVLISPHTPRQRKAFALWTGGAARGSLRQCGVPEAAVDLPGDPSFAARIEAEASARGVILWHWSGAELDHGATVPLWFLDAAGWRNPTVVLGLNYPGESGCVELGTAIRAAAQRSNRRVVVIASGDMSHRLLEDAPAGFHPRAVEFDLAFIECLRRGCHRELLEFDPSLVELAAEDALDSTVVAAAAVDWAATGHEVLSYEGPFGVGYGVAVLHDATARANSLLQRQESSRAVVLPELARHSVEAAFGAVVEKPVATGGLLAESHGVFVTLRRRDGELRGCVGTLTPHCANTAEEVWRLAREAAFRDGRFRPVTPQELPGLQFEVSIIRALEEVADPEELAPHCYGVAVQTPDGRRGVLLPDCEGVDTVERQLEIARRKGDIGPEEPVRTLRFTVEKFIEHPAGKPAYECHAD